MGNVNFWTELKTEKYYYGKRHCLKNLLQTTDNRRLDQSARLGNHLKPKEKVNLAKLVQLDQIDAKFDKSQKG